MILSSFYFTKQRVERAITEKYLLLLSNQFSNIVLYLDITLYLFSNHLKPMYHILMKIEYNKCEPQLKFHFRG